MVKLEVAYNAFDVSPLSSSGVEHGEDRSMMLLLMYVSASLGSVNFMRFLLWLNCSVAG